jgi:hypothetical protein
LQFARDGAARNVRGDPARLVWDVPTATEDVEVAFEFKDLPMP